MYKKLQEMCKAKGTTITALCKEVTGNSGNLATWKKGHIRSDYLSKAADILECSTDYLLGRTDIPNLFTTAVNGNSQNNVNGNNSISVSNSTDEIEKEISSIISGMSFREKTELMTLIYKFADEHKNL